MIIFVLLSKQTMYIHVITFYFTFYDFQLFAFEGLMQDYIHVG